MNTTDLRRLLADEANTDFEPIDPVLLLRRFRSQRRKRIFTGSVLATVVVVAAAAVVISSTNSDAGGRATIVPATASPDPSATKPRVTGAPALRLSWSGQPRDGATATVNGAGFSPGVSVRIVPCVPLAECAFEPAATVQADSDGAFSVRVTARLLINDLAGRSVMCAEDCKYVAESGNGAVNAQTATFDLTVLPPASEKCSTRTLQLSYGGPGSSKSGSRSAVFRVQNTGASPCWVYGPQGVGLDSQMQLPVTGWTVDQSAPAWPPKVITLQAGDFAQFAVTKPACAGASVTASNVWFGQGEAIAIMAVPLPSGAQSQLALCTNVAAPAAGQPAPENVLTVTAYASG